MVFTESQFGLTPNGFESRGRGVSEEIGGLVEDYARRLYNVYSGFRRKLGRNRDMFALYVVSEGPLGLSRTDGVVIAPGDHGVSTAVWLDLEAGSTAFLAVKAGIELDYQAGSSIGIKLSPVVRQRDGRFRVGVDDRVVSFEYFERRGQVEEEDCANVLLPDCYSYTGLTPILEGRTLAWPLGQVSMNERVFDRYSLWMDWREQWLEDVKLRRWGAVVRGLKGEVRPDVVDNLFLGGFARQYVTSLMRFGRMYRRHMELVHEE